MFLNNMYNSCFHAQLELNFTNSESEETGTICDIAYLHEGESYTTTMSTSIRRFGNQILDQISQLRILQGRGDALLVIDLTID